MTYMLYSGTRNASSWAMRAWLALREQGIEFEEKIIDLRRPQRFKQLAMVGEFSPPAAVPVLVTDTKTIFDSLAIMEYASEIGERPLLLIFFFNPENAGSGKVGRGLAAFGPIEHLSTAVVREFFLPGQACDDRK